MDCCAASHAESFKRRLPLFCEVEARGGERRRLFFCNLSLRTLSPLARRGTGGIEGYRGSVTNSTGRGAKGFRPCAPRPTRLRARECGGVSAPNAPASPAGGTGRAG